MWRWGSGPQTTASATISSVTSDVACSKCCGVGSSWASSPGNCSLAHSRWAVLLAAAVAVADAPRELDGLRSEAGDQDRGRFFRQRVELGVLHGVVLAVMVFH